MKRILTALNTWGDGALSKELSKQAPGSVQSPASTVIVGTHPCKPWAERRQADPWGPASLAYLFDEWQAPERHCLKIQVGR